MARPIKYKDHEISMAEDAILCNVWYSGPAANGGTYSVAQAKREIDRMLRRPTCKHAKTHTQATSLGPTKNGVRLTRAIVCDRCDQWLGWDEPTPTADAG